MKIAGNDINSEDILDKFKEAEKKYTAYERIKETEKAAYWKGRWEVLNWLVTG